MLTNPPGMLPGLVLTEQTRLSLARAVLQALEEEFGLEAGIVLSDPAWGLAKKGPRGARTFPLGDHGAVAVPKGSDASGFAREVAARLTDFLALERERERSGRLASLYEAAHEFSAELDLDGTLDTIVQRGRVLTGADICYLSLNDFDRVETYICATAGIRTEAFKRIRLRYGDGLGGLVAKEGRPYYSSDYLHDERFVHVVDPEVDAEAIVSVMGVPLRLGDRVIGVLFIANRYLSSFGDEEVRFLESLADHAAIAIENARLYGRLDRAQRLHRRLTELVLTEQPVGALEKEISEVIGLPVRVFEGAQRAEEAGTETPVRAGPTVLGMLWAEGEELDDERRTALEQAARVVAVHLLKERAVAQAALRTRGELLDAILAGSMSTAELARRAALDGLDLAAPYRAIVFPGEETAVARRVPRAFLAPRLGYTVVLLPADAPLPPADLAGVGPPGVGALGVARSVHEGTRVLEVARLLRRTGAVSRDDLGIYSLLLDPERSAELRSQARSLLEPIITYDEAHGNVLVSTLEAYLDAQGRPAEAARRLFVHVNSLYYRLSRIRALAGWNLDDPELRLQLHLACRILRLGDIGA